MSAPTPAELAAKEAFIGVVKAYVDLHDQLAQRTKELGEVRKKKKELGVEILEYMRANKLDECNIRGCGKLERRQTKRLEPLKKEHILQELSGLLGEPRAADVVVSIFGRRAVAETDSLRRVRKPGGDPPPAAPAAR
jgi:hypothetical protein